jgi:hypothetical protein
MNFNIKYKIIEDGYLIDLRYHNFDDNNIENLFKELENFSNIIIIDLSFGDLTKESLKTFLKLEKNIKTLKFINLSNNFDIDEKDIDNLPKDFSKKLIWISEKDILKNKSKIRQDILSNHILYYDIRIVNFDFNCKVSFVNKVLAYKAFDISKSIEAHLLLFIIENELIGIRTCLGNDPRFCLSTSGKQFLKMLNPIYNNKDKYIYFYYIKEFENIDSDDKIRVLQIFENMILESPKNIKWHGEKPPIY